MWANGVRPRFKRRQPAAACTRALLLALVFLLGAAGCTYAKEEPGLFSERRPESTPPPPFPPSPSPEPPEATNPQLPVAGRQTWVSAEGLDVQVRLAVHAVRRMPGATVLDWSITPVLGAGLSTGDRIPSGLGLGLMRRTQGDVSAVLLDPDRGKVYRPLSHRSAQEFHHCLCSPIWVAQLSFRMGETRLLQVAYPSLPAAVRFVDVALATVPPFVHVPVTGIGMAPTTLGATDLTSASRVPQAVAAAVTFSYPRGRSGRRQSITVNEVVASPGLTSLKWTITSVTEQTAFGLLPSEPPLAADRPPRGIAVSQNAVSGPRLEPADRSGPALESWWMTESFTGRDFVECLCTELGLWAAALREAGGQVTVTTNFPPLPVGTTSVDVLLPGVGRLPDLAVTQALDSAALTGAPVAAPEQDPWTYATERPPSGWDTSDWPTPLPAANQLRDYTATVEDLVGRVR